MKTKRLIRIIGTIDEESFKEFSEELDRLEQESKKPIEVELSSGGGSAYDALAFVSRMRLSPCALHVTGHGLVASAAVIILAYGKKRRLAKEAWVMVHEDSAKLKGEVKDLEREIGHMRGLEVQWNKLLAGRTSISPHEWQAYNKNTSYLTPETCKLIGLIEEIV